MKLRRRVSESATNAGMQDLTPSEEAPEEAFGDHSREEQEQVEVREEKEREPAPLIVRLAGELDGEPHEASAEEAGEDEGERTAHPEGRRGQ